MNSLMCDFGDEITEMTGDEIDLVVAAGTWSNISYGLGAASVTAAGLAVVPTPASGALAGFAVLTGLMSAGAGYLSSSSGSIGDKQHVRPK